MVDEAFAANRDEVRRFLFSDQQFEYLHRDSALNRKLPGEWDEARRAVQLSKTQYDAWFQELTDRLIGFGFTREWEATSEGAIIESIIDILTGARSSG